MGLRCVAAGCSYHTAYIDHETKPVGEGEGRGLGGGGVEQGLGSRARSHGCKRLLRPWYEVGVSLKVLPCDLEDLVLNFVIYLRILYFYISEKTTNLIWQLSQYLVNIFHERFSPKFVSLCK